MNGYKPDFVVYVNESPTFIVEIKKSQKLGEKEIENFKRFLLTSKIEYGLLSSFDESLVLKDTYESHDISTFKEYPIDTKKILAGNDGKIILDTPSTYFNMKDIKYLVRRWLLTLTTNFERAIPPDPNCYEFFVPDIVGSVMGGKIVEEPLLSTPVS